MISLEPLVMQVHQELAPGSTETTPAATSEFSAGERLLCPEGASWCR